MKKIKTLYWFVVVLIAIYFVSFLANIYLALYTPGFMNFPEEHYQKFIFGYYTQFVDLAISAVTFIALIFLKKGLLITIKNGFFANQSSIKFKVTGQLLIISGALSLLWNLLLFEYSKGKTLFSGIEASILLMLIGYSLLVLTSYIQNGSLLKSENDLTI